MDVRGAPLLTLTVMAVPMTVVAAEDREGFGALVDTRAGRAGHRGAQGTVWIDGVVAHGGMAPAVVVGQPPPSGYGCCPSRA